MYCRLHWIVPRLCRMTAYTSNLIAYEHLFHRINPYVSNRIAFEHLFRHTTAHSRNLNAFKQLFPRMNALASNLIAFEHLFRLRTPPAREVEQNFGYAVGIHCVCAKIESYVPTLNPAVRDPPQLAQSSDASLPQWLS